MSETGWDKATYLECISVTLQSAKVKHKSPRFSQLFGGDLEMDVCFETLHANGMRESFL